MLPEFLLSSFRKAVANLSVDSTDFSSLAIGPFESVSVFEKNKNEKIVSLHYKNGEKEKAPSDAQYVDVFFLRRKSEIGAHHHNNSTAKVVCLKGEGRAQIGTQDIAVGINDHMTFQAGITHNVYADRNQDMVFLSLQDQPIIQSDGTLDYHPV